MRGKGAQPEQTFDTSTNRYGRTVDELFIDGMNVQQTVVANRHDEIFWEYANQCPWNS